MKACFIRYGSCLALLMGTMFAIGCGGDAPTANITSGDGDSETSRTDVPGGGAATLTSSVPNSESEEVALPKKNLYPEVVIKTSMGNIRVRLNAEKSPITVDNFLEGYVDREFYSNTIFHHVDPGYVVAGGFTPELEAKQVRAPIRNEASNGLKNIRGTVTMSRSPEYSNSATSQFFINITAAATLDYDESSENDGYCVFGEVVDGMDVVEAISKAEVHDTGDFPQLPVEAVVITSIERID
ncbi:MAG: peptidylprolyl isomerase [Planctomycetales bacterium]|nr:peptidylprolyl isomerase [Planctomycetales bacterium]